MNQKKYKVFPWWKAYLLKSISGLRKKYQNPQRILKDYLKKDMIAADIGCGMGYFSLPMADMVGSNGKVISVDLQQQMLNELKKKAAKENNQDIIELVHCSEDTLGLNRWQGKIDFMLVFAVAHEVSDRRRLFKEAAMAMRTGGKVLFAEPQGHVTRECFEESVSFAKECGLKLIDSPKINLSHTILFEK